MIKLKAGQATLGSVLEQGEPGLELLRKEFPSLELKAARIVAKWVLLARCGTSLDFALDHVFHIDPTIRYLCRLYLRKYDTVAYCPFLAR